jgi:TonB-dependent receptor
MKHSFKLNAISAVVLSSFLSLPAIAQETSQQTDSQKETTEVERKIETTEQKKSEEADKAVLEVIEVTGFRGSLQKAINAKRFNESVSDSIHAEDIGKSTDQNIADALSRITGVSVQEEGGEGTRISVRGASPTQNQISINGVALTGGISSPDGGTNDNSVDLSSFDADILSSIDVVKTSAADQDEGSLGANINLKTVRPLSINNPRRNIAIEGRYNEFADDEDFRATVSFSDKYFDDRIGFIVTATKDKQNVRQDRINTGYEAGAVPISDLLASGTNRTATDAATGNPIRVLGYQRDADGALLLDENGNRLLNPIESLLDYDPATQTLVEGDLFVMAPRTVNFSLSNDIRERFTISSGLQYRPTDKLDIQLDVTHTQQTVKTEFNSLNMNISPLVLINENDDNTALNVVDLETNTLVSSRSSSITGGFNRTTAQRDLETNVATLDIAYNITDNLSADLILGYSNTRDETPDQDEVGAFLSIGTATWGSAGRNIVEAQPIENLETVGFDCLTAGLGVCNYFTGTQLAQFDALDGSTNFVSSRFNPFDLEHNHLGNLMFRKNKLEDENKSVFLDFDYLLDNEYVTQLEFGAKYAKRSRDVNINNFNVTNSNQIIDVDDPDAPFERRGLATISIGDILSGEAFPYDDFADGLPVVQDARFFGGWPTLDARKALELVAGKDQSEVGFRENNLGTREISTETVSAYFKANFEFLDGQLTGNIGIRYVKDESEATGVGSISYVRAPQLLDPYDLIVRRNLADMSQAPCPAGIPIPDGDTRFSPENENELSNCWAFAITHGYNFNNANTIPIDENGNFVIPGADGQVGPDVNRILFVDENGNIIQSNSLPDQIFDRNGNLVPTSPSNWARFNRNGFIWPFLDRSTAFTGPNGSGDEVQNRTAPVQNEGSNELWLPSLTLNYALNQETIVRFALSKTMTRPRFDSLNPANRIVENQFGPTAGNSGNTRLRNLTSNNIDFAYEWYFNDTGLLSAGLFFKDMEDFEETVTTPFHYKDVRDEIDLQSADLLLDFDANRVPGDEDNCQPLRYAAGFFDRWTIECDVALINTVTNGDGASIKGLELGYTQNYDFLPGKLSGLGASINYTFQDSESDPVEIGSTGRFLAVLPQAFTPRHSGNATIYYEKDGIQVRLANRYTGKQLVTRGQNGAIFQDSYNRLDLSASYRINKNLSITFNALNLTDDSRRNFVTASGTLRGDNIGLQEVVLDEGNPITDSSVPTSRTQAVFKTGRQYRIGVRGTF